MKNKIYMDNTNQNSMFTAYYAKEEYKWGR